MLTIPCVNDIAIDGTSAHPELDEVKPFLLICWFSHYL